MGRYIIGADEVGRGCLAGPVTVGAVLVKEGSSPVSGVKDSKKLTASKREQVADALRTCPEVQFAIASVPADIIDKDGISAALKHCFAAAVSALIKKNREVRTVSTLPGEGVLVNRPVVVQIDGNPIKGLDFPVPTEYIVKGDDKVWAIGAASILAKVWRDAFMGKLAPQFQDYAWEQNKGYGSPVHQKAIREKGLTPYHRATFCRAFTTLAAVEDSVEDLFKDWV